jgi:hypothetical protein
MPQLKRRRGQEKHPLKGACQWAARNLLRIVGRIRISE